MSKETFGRGQIHWFPGHMAKTLRRMEAKLPLVDAVVQLLDARIPHSSLNPDLQRLYGSKPRLYLLNKSDLADETITQSWLAFFRQEGAGCVAVNSLQRGAASAARRMVEDALAELLARRSAKGMAGAKTRLMVTGIPNVGKSTFINTWAGGARTQTADRPGVTRGEQWIAAGGYELLDVPGVLPKKLENEDVAVNLALIGAIPDTLLDTEAIAAGFLRQVVAAAPRGLLERYKLQADALPQDGFELLALVGRKRGMLVAGGEVDLHRAAVMVLDEFRAGKLGRLSLERPEEREA